MPAPDQPREDEFAAKLAKLRGHMQKEGLEGLLLTQQSSVAWLTGGAESHIVLASVDSAGPLMITQDSVYLLCPNIEAPRMLEEELSGLDVIDCRYPWYEEAHGETANLKSIIDDRRWTKDTDSNIAAYLTECLSSLSEAEQERYRWVGKQAEEAIREACHEVRKGMTEFEIAGILSAKAHEREIWPVLVLVAADDRLRQHRHPIPTSNSVENSVMLVLCARRWGLIANLTRIVHIGSVPEDLRKRHKAVCTVDATFIHETRPGVSYGEVFAKGQAAYADQGYPDEWMLHHQGGPTSYLGRLFKATPESKARVHVGQAVAWNPSIAGTKSEDTFLVQGDTNEIITDAKDWPMLEVQVGAVKYERPDILVQ